MRQKRAVMYTSVIIVLTCLMFLLVLQFSRRESAALLPATITEAPGGLLGGRSSLRCPINLSGLGPSWRNIRVGVSTLDDWKTQFAPFIHYIGLVTPYPPVGTSMPISADYAPYYKDNSFYYGGSADNLPRGSSACVVDNIVQAFFISTEYVSDVPQYVEQLISLLGPVERISWNEGDQYSRVLHWPQLGISASVDATTWITGIYFYPYQTGEDRWPMNALLKEITPSLFPNETIALEVFDQRQFIGLKDIEGTVAANPIWPTRTPHAHEQ